MRDVSRRDESRSRTRLVVVGVLLELLYFSTKKDANAIARDGNLPFLSHSGFFTFC